MQDPVTWYGINYTGTQMTQWDFQNKRKSRWTGKSSFVLKIPLRHLRPSVIYSVPCDWILQMAYSLAQRQNGCACSAIFVSEFACSQSRTHSRSQRPRSFWPAPRIATSGFWPGPTPEAAIHGHPVTLRMLRVKCDKSDWFWSQSIVFIKPFKTGMSLDRARGRDSWC